jgi:hypothetical protein
VQEALEENSSVKVEKGWRKEHSTRIHFIKPRLSEYNMYADQANRIAKIMHQKYRSKPNAEFQFGLPLHDAFFAFPSSPIDLRYVCHPANLLPLNVPAEDFDLKAAIRAFEAKYGKVEFPSKCLYSYKLSRKTDKKELNVLGFDPGRKNFGCFAGKIVNGILIPLESSMLQNPIQELKGDNLGAIGTYTEEMRSFIACYEPDAIVIERFMSRGLKGKTIELVSLMVGILASLVYEYRLQGFNITIQSVTAASWKNRVNKVFPLVDVYADLKPHKVPDHCVDAALMSLYAISEGKENPYLYLKDDDAYFDLLEGIVGANPRSVPSM